MRTLCVLLILAALGGAVVDAEGIPPTRYRPLPVPGYILTLVLQDDTGAPIDARVSVLDVATGTCYGPVDPHEPVYESWSGHNYFHARDRVEVVVAAGDVRILIAKGPEYSVFDRTITVARDMTYSARIRRLVDAAWYGWYGGDTHVHIAHGGLGAAYDIDNVHMAMIARAEDLRVTCVLTNGPYFNGGLDPAGDSRHLIHYGMEYRSALYGHMGLLGMKSLIPAACCLPGTAAYPLNRMVCDAAHAQGATVIVSHPVPMNPALFMDASLPWPYSGFARELPANVIMGDVDAFDLFSYSNYSDDPTREIWFDLLNLGRRLPLSVGTDASVNRTYDPPPGGYRVYVRPTGAFTFDSWLQGLREGRSFATNGPLLIGFLLDGKRPGDELEIADGELHEAAGRVTLFTREPVETLELYWNGQMIATHSLPGTTGWIVYDFTLALKPEPGWVVARVIGHEAAPTTIGWVEQAITSPIYIVAPDRRFEPKQDSVERFDAWIRDLQTLVLERGYWESLSQMNAVWNELEDARRRLYGRPVPEDDLPVVEQPVSPESISVTLLSRGGAHLLQAGGKGEGRLEVFDVTGRLVHHSEARGLPALFTWDAAGERVPPGIYFARVRSDGAQSTVQRLLVLR